MWRKVLRDFCWKLLALSSSELILKIGSDLTKLAAK